MVSVKNEINEVLLNCVSDLENRLEESRSILSDIQEKMDSKVSEAKEYKVQVDAAKESIGRLEDEIKSLETDLVELKEKYSKKNLVAVIDAGTREINAEIKKKQDEIQIHKNKIGELTNRARSIKDLLMNLKKDKKIKEERLKELENCTNYYKVRLTEIVKFAEEHDDLDDYFVSFDEEESVSDSANVFEDIVGIEDKEEIKESNIFDEEVEEISIEDAEEVFNDVINSDEEDDDSETKELENVSFEDIFTDKEENEEVEEIVEVSDETEDAEIIDFNDSLELNEEDTLDENEELEETTELKISDLLNAVKEPISMVKEEKEENVLEKLDGINKTIDREFADVFGQDINEPIKTVDFFGNEYKEETSSEEEIVNKLTNIGLDYYSFTEDDRNQIKSNFNEQVMTDLVDILKTNKIQLDNVYVDAKILFNIAPAELDNIVSKLLSAGQSADAIGYVLDKLPLVDSKLLDATISNYGDYIKNIDIVDIIFKSLKGDK